MNPKIYAGLFNRFAPYREALISGEVQLQAEVERIIQLIHEKSHLNAYLEVFEEEARIQADSIAQKLKNGNAGQLAGMIIGIKDNMCLRGHRVSAGSKILEHFESLFTATAVQRLLDEDAIIIGRLNCDEFAMGSSNENSAYGPTLNPLNENCVPGGSSGASAAALAAGLCHASLGSDTGGSIRQPAAFTGLIGLKPTYGRISRHGLIAYASSFDQIGPFSNSIEDIALLLEIMAGPDEFDSTASTQAVPAYSKSLKNKSKKYKIALPKSFVQLPGLDPYSKSHLYEVLEALKNEGHHIEEVDFELLEYVVPVYYLLTTAEASSNLARFDGVHYGFRAPNADSLENIHKWSRTLGFGKEVQRRILLGTFVLSSGFYDAYYAKAQKARRLILEQVQSILGRFDFIIGPTAPHEAFELGRKDADPTVMYLEDIYTVLANITGLPAISIPTALGPQNLPLGTQIMARSFEEGELLAFSQEVLNIFNIKK